jgi:methyl-accepting chemotaxis protein
MSGSITAITQGATQLARLMSEISQAARQQTTGVEQVAQAIVQMEKVTQTTADRNAPDARSPAQGVQSTSPGVWPGHRNLRRVLRTAGTTIA